MKKTNLQKIAEFVTYLQVPFSVVDKSFVLCCSEEQYNTLSKVLLFYCTEFRIQPCPPVDEHFEHIYIQIPFENIIV